MNPWNRKGPLKERKVPAFPIYGGYKHFYTAHNQKLLKGIWKTIPLEGKNILVTHFFFFVFNNRRTVQSEIPSISHPFPFSAWFAYLCGVKKYFGSLTYFRPASGHGCMFSRVIKLVASGVSTVDGRAGLRNLLLLGCIPILNTWKPESLNHTFLGCIDVHYLYAEIRQHLYFSLKNA